MAGGRRALAVAALLSLLAGCASPFVAARVPDALLQGDGGNGWARDAARSDTGPRGEAGGLAQHQTLAYVDDGQGGNGGYAASLVVTTAKLLPSPSEAQLRQLLSDQVRARSEEAGIRLNETATLEGSRALADGHRTLYFVFTGTITGEGPLFTTRDATAKILGEVWNCPAAGTSVSAVGLAQVSSVSRLGGIPVATNQDPRNWREIAADPQGTIEGQRGADGLLYNVVCSA